MAHRIKYIPENKYDEENKFYTITFGRYKYSRIGDIPINYVKWFLNNVDNGSVSHRVLERLINRVKYAKENFSSIYSYGDNGKIIQIKLFKLILTMEWI
jgi:hypothetical protein